MENLKPAYTQVSSASFSPSPIFALNLPLLLMQIQPDEWYWRDGMSLNDVTREMCNAWKSDRTIASVVTSSYLGKLASQLMGWPGNLREYGGRRVMIEKGDEGEEMERRRRRVINIHIGARVAQDDIFVSLPAQYSNTQVNSNTS